MDIQDGFIAGIFDYCDSWCAACPFTSRCRLFADRAAFDAALDPTLKPLFRAPAPRPAIAREHQPLCEQALTYLDRVFAWMRSHEGFAAALDPDDPRAVVSWFYSMIYVKVRRAVRGLSEDAPATRDCPGDADGSAKVALLGVERSLAAWLQIVEGDLATWKEAEPFVYQLLWLRDEIERLFPNARAFIRPGFDEPGEVARLLASEGV